MIPLARVRAAVTPWLTPRLALVVGLAAGVIGLTVSRSHATKRAFEEGVQAAASQHDTDTLRVVEESDLEHTAQFVSAIDDANAARKAHAKAVSHVTIIDAKTVSVDGAAPSADVPAPIVEQIITSGAQALYRDSLVHAANVSLVRDLRAEVTVISRQRDVAELAVKRSRNRWGWRAGVLLGAGAVVGLLKLLR